MKRLWNRIKTYFVNLKNKWNELRRVPTKKEIFEHLFEWICVNRPRYFAMSCHCGSMLTAQDIHEKQYSKDFVWLFWDCSRCNMRIEKRYKFDGTEIKE